MRLLSVARRRPWWGAGVGVLVMAMAACSSGSSHAAGTTAPASVAAPATTIAPATTSAPTTAPPPTTAAPATTAAPDPAATLSQALDGLTASYHFDSTVTVNGAVALTADGDRIGDGSRLTLTSNDGNASYVITTDGSWVMLPGGDWQPLTTGPANTDPIAALRSPSGVQSKGGDATSSALSVAVPPAALGITGDGPVQLDVTIKSGVLSTVTYATTVSGAPATVVATFGPPADPTPVTAPS
jgi:hypothetical protein